MFSRGLRIVRYRGRYFVYYHHQDSSPKDLGKAIVDEIPREPEKYKEWLSQKRDVYAKLTQSIESEALTITEGSKWELINTEKGKSEAEDGKRVERSWAAIDQDLDKLPTFLCDFERYEWSYTVDLDNEIFAILGLIFFDLWNVPEDRWIRAIGYKNGIPMLCREIAPEGSNKMEMKVGSFESFENELEQYRESNQRYQYEALQTNAILSSLPQIMALVLFQRFTCFYKVELRDIAWRTKTDTFAFRETAFAILSIAADQYSLDCLAGYNGEITWAESDGYLVERVGVGAARLMPLFGSGCHVPGREPGSAPRSCIYWLCNILISIVPDSALQNDLNAVIAQAVEQGKKEGKLSFSIVLFSIDSAVLVEARITSEINVVQYSKVLSICNGSNKNEHEGQITHRKESNDGWQKPTTRTPLGQISFHNHGFVILNNFFTAATVKALGDFSFGVFPPEIYANIIDKVDNRTRKTCAQVSQPFHELCQRYFAFGENLTVVKFIPNEKPWESSRLAWLSIHIDALGTFEIRDNEGCGFECELDSGNGKGIWSRKKKLTWSPVIGETSRTTMIPGVSVGLKSLKENVITSQEICTV